MTAGIYFDCFAGASGDMIVGAMLDLGLDFASLKDQLSSLCLSGYELKAERVRRGAIAATRFIVEVDEHDQPARKLADIRRLIEESTLGDAVKSRSILVFEKLAEAEARVHGSTIEEVHFHEVGAVDSIIDIVGAMIGLEILNITRFHSSPLRVGKGTVQTAHGLLPVPAPGTAELLKGATVYSGEIEGEFVTPTGAAIVTSLCETFGPMPQVMIERAGYGAGARDHRELPNVLRLIRFKADEAITMRDSVMIIETNIDDMNPQAYGFVMQRAFEAGALDVFMTATQMKKDRPGVLLTVLCKGEQLDSITDLLLAETTTLGVRYYEANRRVAERIIETVDTEYGAIRIKVAQSGARTLHFQPEYEDCAQAALQLKVSLIEVQRAAES
ncbi:MAG TPA: nickel pincer cofactor biosynthesis protein LarC, partial [Blastocatellia bacterium]